MLRLRIPFFIFFLGLLTAHAAETTREILSLNPDWRFLKSDPAGAEQPGFDDSRWESVSVPHTYNDTDTFDDWSPSGHRGEVNQWSGPTWYRKIFKVPAGWSGKTVVVEFEAVRQIAEVYLNGKRVGSSRNGFLPFGFDLTPCLKYGEANVLAVRCDNSFARDRTGDPAIDPPGEGASSLPWNNPHWHPAHGGIYRNVWIHALNPVHLTLPVFSDLGTTGTYVFATKISPQSAELGIEAQVRNSTGKPADIRLKAEVLDRDGNIVARMEEARTLNAGETREVKLAGTLKNPQRWEPAYPYLYSVRLKLEKNGKPSDETTIPFGVRSVRWDVQTGCWINGHPLKLHGWGQKSTDEWAGLGAAYPDWMHYHTVRLMREAGGNFIRWGHTAGGPAQIAAGDQYGQITIQPGVDGEADIKEDAIWNIRAEAFRDTIIYYRNHPSILIWEGGNQSTSLEHVTRLRGFMDKYDPHGGRAYAHRRANSVVGKFMDVTIGTEGGHEEPQLPVVEGEYNREEAPRRAWDRMTPPYDNYHAEGTYDLSAEEFAINQVGQWWKKLGSHANHCGGANWIFSDSTSGGRVTTEVTRTSGEVDAVRLPKEAYHVCSAMFRDEPTVHIVGHWNYPEGTTKPVYVVSNQPKVELFVNGKSFGAGRQSDHYLYTFGPISWEPGSIKAVAFDPLGNPVTSQEKHTAGKPDRLKLTPITGPGGLRADGADVVLFDVEAVDSHGARCPTVENRVDFSVSGPGIWRGGYNSGKIKSTNHEYLDLECGINRVAIRSTLRPGTLTLTAKSDGLEAASASVDARPLRYVNGATPVRPAAPEQGLLVAPAGVGQIVSRPAGSNEPTPAAEGAFIKHFNYSGPTPGASLARNVRTGQRVYADREEVFADVPVLIKGADQLQLPDKDRNYSALDLISLTVHRDGILALAFDKRIKPPDWLVRDYVDSGETLRIGSAIYSVYQRNVKAGETLTLGGNSDSPNEDARMYLVFVCGT